MAFDRSLLPGRLLRRAGPPEPVDRFAGVQIADPRLAGVLSPDARLVVLHDGTLHAEGPVWSPADGRLFWSDVPNRRLLQWQDDGEVTVAIDATYFMNGNAIDREGRLVHCEHGRRCISRSASGLGRDRDRTGDDADPIVTHFEGRRLNSPNDITVASDGAIWFTDPTFGILMPNQGSVVAPELDHRSVYRFDPASGSLGRMADLEQPNGLFFSPDDRTLYVSDTALSLDEIPRAGSGRTHEILAFDVGEGGRLSNRRLFCRTEHGYPDGFVVDERGWLWSSAADGVHVFAPDGTRLGAIPTPQVVSNCCFGGPGQRRLFLAATKCLYAIDLE